MRLIVLLILCLPIALLADDMPDFIVVPSDLEAGHKIEGWWLSEKLDGVRGYWTGKRMLSRGGHEIILPAWFRDQLPDFALDGELWTERGDFSRLSGIVRRKVPGEEWRAVSYNIFEVPGAPGTFIERIRYARDWLEVHPAANIRVIEQQPCRGREHLQAELERIEALGGEGLMLRRPGQPYGPGSGELLRVKRFYEQAGVVIGHKSGEGRHAGRMGSLQVELENGVRFYIGTGFSDAERDQPPPVGSRIRFSYKELNQSGIPRHASFVEVIEP